MSGARLGPPRIVVAGLGSVDRRDDGAGPIVASLATRSSSAVENVGPLADPLDLLGLWDGADLAVVIDAVRSGAPPGTVRLVELGGDGVGEPVEAGRGDAHGGSRTTSTHGIGLAGVLRLARSLGRAPRRLVVVGIEGTAFGFGEGLSPAVEAALPGALRCVAEVIEEVATCV